MANGRIFHCDCNKCGYKVSQFSSVSMVRARVISNKKILGKRIIGRKRFKIDYSGEVGKDV